MIQHGNSTLRERRSLRTSAHTVVVDGQCFHVVLDANRRTLVTFLPLDEWPPELAPSREVTAAVRADVEAKLAEAALHRADDLGCCSVCPGYVAHPCRVVVVAEERASEFLVA